MSEVATFTVFSGSQRMANGDRRQASLAAGKLTAAAVPDPVLIFNDQTGEQVDLDYREALDDVSKEVPSRAGEPTPGTASDDNPPRRSPGRPKLGVVGREITLLPRHWEWLSTQPGGPSVALRKLVEKARRDNEEKDRIRRSREAAYRFISAVAGNAPGYEDAIRALFSGNMEAFAGHMQDWPRDVREYALKF